VCVSDKQVSHFIDESVLLRMTVVLPLSALVKKTSECSLVKDLVVLSKDDMNLLWVLSSMLLWKILLMIFLSIERFIYNIFTNIRLIL